jgi:catechol 2,3-dioxygenase-like lactoylglutathione lyase family enzyme
LPEEDNMPLPSGRLHHVGVVVQDLAASIAWYERHLGFVQASSYDFPGATVAFIERGELRIELFQTEGAKPMAGDREQPATNLKMGGINHFAIMVDGLDQTVADLAALGVEIVSAPRLVPDGSGDRFVFIRDNERMLIELFEPAG